MRTPPLVTLCGLLLSAACASSPDPASATVQRTSTPQVDAELLEAFDGPAEEPAPVQAEAPVRAAPVDPLAPARTRFRTQVEVVRAAMTAGDGPGAIKAAEVLPRLAGPLGPQALQEAAGVAYEAARHADDGAAAIAAATRWSLTCGPTETERCRKQALAAWDRALVKAKAPASARTRVTGLIEADACLRRAEKVARRRQGTLPDCLTAAQAAYRQAGDSLMSARVLLARARIGAREKRPSPGTIAAALRAGEHCTEPRCVGVQREALQLESELYLARGEHEDAARAAFREAAVLAGSLPAHERLWARPPQVDKACAALDRASTEGTCRKLEQRALGRLTYRDYSQRELPGEGLPGATVEEVNAHYGPTLQDCLKAEAQRLTPPAREVYTVRWVVLNEGRTAQVHLEQQRQDRGPLAQCLRTRLADWRYPRFKGEWQHVEQRFTIDAVPRRDLR